MLGPPQDAIAIELEPADSADARFCLDRYFGELAQRFDGGFDLARYGGADPDEMTPPRGWFLMARRGGKPVGCGVLKRLEAETGEIKRVWCSADARGLGIATRIMDRLEAIARHARMAALRLDTNKALSEARTMYLKRGYAEIARYNDNPYAHHWFEKRLGA